MISKNIVAMNLHHRYKYTLKEAWKIVNTYHLGGSPKRETVYKRDCGCDGRLNDTGFHKYKNYKDICNQLSWETSDCLDVNSRRGITYQTKIKELKKIAGLYETCATRREQFDKDCIEGEADQGHKAAIQKMRRHKGTCEITIKDLQKQRNRSEISVTPPPCAWSRKPSIQQPTILTTISKTNPAKKSPSIKRSPGRSPGRSAVKQPKTKPQLSKRKQTHTKFFKNLRKQR